MQLWIVDVGLRIVECKMSSLALGSGLFWNGRLSNFSLDNGCVMDCRAALAMTKGGMR